jgi:ankyrin repeat protein
MIERERRVAARAPNALRALALAFVACLSASASYAAGEEVIVRIEKLQSDPRPSSKVPFPAISDWSTLKIALARGPCLGDCPGYTVEIDGDGTVRYEGGLFTAVPGKHVTHIPVSAVRVLYDSFVKADFFWTFDEYRATITDNPTFLVTIAFDGNKKQVVDYAGLMVGMPEEVEKLEDAIDAAAATKKWVFGDETTFASLEAEHWDFRADDDEHHSLIGSLAERRQTNLLRQVLKAGTPANNKYGCRGLEDAAHHGDAILVEMLLKAGAAVHWDAPPGKEYETCDVLSGAVESGVPLIVRAVLDRHPVVNWRDYGGVTPLIRAARAYPDNRRSAQDFAAVVKMLLGAGADVNARDKDGTSAIMEVNSNASVVRVLLAAGAKDINKKNSRGETPLMGSYQADIAQALLDGGADPWIVDEDGKNAYEVESRTFGENMAALVLKRWMVAHPKPTRSR